MNTPRTLMIPLLVIASISGLHVMAGARSPVLAAGDPTKSLDSYEEAIRLVAAVRDGQAVPGLEDRLEASYAIYAGGRNKANPGFYYDFADKPNGDFSIAFEPGAGTDFEGLQIETSLWADYFELDPTCTLKFSLKIDTGAARPTTLKVALIDARGNSVEAEPSIAEGRDQWQALAVPLGDFSGDASFDLDAIQSVRITGLELDGDSLVKLDFVRFEDGEGSVLGITDKSLEQRLREQEASLEKRRLIAWEDRLKRPASKKNSDLDTLMKVLASLYLETGMEEANARFREVLNESGREGKWSLFKTPYLLRMYYLFSSREGRYPGRLEPGTEQLLLEVIWDRTVDKNDIHWARQSTWYLDGSENHDINMKACNLVSSRIFMNEPDYSDRVYPDHGFGGGYHYGRSGYYGPGIDPASRHGGGRADLADGKQYTAKDHYEAWLRYMKEFFPERAKHGFMLEYNSPGYCKHSMNFIELMYMYGGDEELKQTIGDFKTLYYANWAQTAAAGVSGGPKTRWARLSYNDSHAGMIRPLVGGLASTGYFTFWSSFNDYRLPPAVLRMVLDKEGMGSFVYRSRGIGEETGEIPRPLGAERSLVVNPDSRFLKYSYVTPYYTLGTQMDHPYAIHSHLSVANRFLGLTLTSDRTMKIAPVSVPSEPDFRGNKGKYTTKGMYRSVQHDNTLIFQRTINYVVQHPDWFPHYKQKTNQGVWIGDQWDEKIERDGWVFLRERNVYAAVRVVAEDVEYERKRREENSGNQVNFYSDKDLATSKVRDKGYSWADDGKYMALMDNTSPVILRAGDSAEYGDFNSFIEDTTGIRIELYKTVVPTFNELVVNMKSDGSGDEIVFNAGNSAPPTVNGEIIDYSYPMTFDSPYLKSAYGSGLIKMGMGSDTLRLKF